MDSIFDIFLLEAVMNGLLLGGLLALLSLGLNLIFGVIDVVWICYAELIMIGMYTIWWLHVPQGVSLWIAFPAAILLVAAMGLALEKNMSPTLKPGRRTPRLRKSMPKMTVASACRKNSTPPVTSSWLIGSAASTGRMMK